MIEKFENERFEERNASESDPGVAEEAPKMSRREFLRETGRWAVGALGAYALHKLPFGEDNVAWAKEVKEGHSWMEGLHALQDDAINSENETGAFYVIRKDDSNYWEQNPAGSEFEISHDLEFVKREIAKKPREVRMLHTHTIQSFIEQGLSEEELRGFRDGASPPPSMPPSERDLLNSIRLKSTYGNKDTDLKTMVVDGRGVWEYDVDFNSNGFPNDYAENAKTYENTVKYLEKDKDAFKHLNKVITGYLRQAPVETEEEAAMFVGRMEPLLDYLRTKLKARTMEVVASQIEAEKRLNETYGRDYGEMSDAIENYYWKNVSNEPPDMAKLVTNAKKLGFIISFKTMEEIEKEE